MPDDSALEAALRRVMSAGPANEQSAERLAYRLESTALPPQKRSFAWWPSALMDWNFAPAWPRVATLAGAAMLGISIGLSGYGMRIATDLDLVRVASDDAANNVFDLDLGFRP